ncbi:MAG: endonuclease MutS2 [Erysipelotrichales bacterium]
MIENMYKKIEFDKVLSRVEAKAQIKQTKDIIINSKFETDFDSVQMNLNNTNEFITLFFSYGEFSLRYLNDLDDIINKVNKNLVLEGVDFVRLSNLQKQKELLDEYQSEISEIEKYPHFNKLYLNIKSLFNYTKKINRMINNEGLVYEDATPRLVEINGELNNLRNQIQNELKSIINNKSEHLSENIITYRNNRAVLPIRAASKNIIKGIIHDESSSASTVFIEPTKVVELNNRIQSLEYEKNDEINVVLKQLSNDTKQVIETITSNYKIMIELDLIKAKASYSIDINGIIPKLNQDSAKLEIYQGRHPLIDPQKVVANDFYMCNNESKYRIVLVSGSNTGGKTVALKMVGLFALMVQSGLAIPADEKTNMPIYTNVFVDIGDEQSIADELSTFSSHMNNISKIVNNVGEYSLVLLDELGSGTDPREGENLALSIIEYLYQHDASIIVTTHYSKLKNYALTTDYVRSASVLFDKKDNKPVYQISFDTYASSNAFEIASHLGLNDEIIEQAKKLYHGDLNTSDELLLKLQDQQIIVKEEKAKYEEAFNKYEKLTKELKELELQLNKEKDKIIEKARDEANSIIRESKKKSDKIIDELKQSKSFVNHEANKTRQDLDDLLFNKIEEVDNKHQEFKVGDVVELIKLKRQGIISEILNKNNYEVSIGNIKTKVKHNEMRFLSNKPPKEIKKKEVKRTTKKNVPMELNLIGLRVDDALIELRKYLDSAIMSDMTKVRIIHGFGTGALREAVHQELKKNKVVKSFAFAKYNEGGQGATIVEL